MCLEAASKAQSFRDVHELLEAAEQFHRCASAACPAVVQADCTRWAQDIREATPTVVLSATDASGNDLFDVTVETDGKPWQSKLDGTAVPIDPGLHRFRFKRPDGTAIEQQALLPEGQKLVPVSVVFGTPSAPPATVPSATPPRTTRSSRWRTVAWIAGGVGIACLGVGTGFGVDAISEKNAADSMGCVGVRCPTTAAPTRDAAKTAADVSTALVIAGGAVAGGGLALWFLAPGFKRSTAAIAVRPSGVELGVPW